MEIKITAKELIMFITKFNLFNVQCDFLSFGLSLMAPGYGCEKCNYVLFNDGTYVVQAWVDDVEEPYWEEVSKGDMWEV